MGHVLAIILGDPTLCPPKGGTYTATPLSSPCGGAGAKTRFGEHHGTGAVLPYGRGGRMDWLHYARCKDEDPELFFPVGPTGPAAGQVEAAKTICRLCEVRGECLEWAM